MNAYNKKNIGLCVMLVAVVTLCAIGCGKSDESGTNPPEQTGDTLFSFYSIDDAYKVISQTYSFAKTPEFKNYNIKYKSENGFDGDSPDPRITDLTMSMEEMYGYVKSFSENQISSWGTITLAEKDSSLSKIWKGMGYTVQINNQPPEPVRDTTFSFEGLKGVDDLAKKISEFAKSPKFPNYKLKFQSNGGFGSALLADMEKATETMEGTYDLIQQHNSNEVTATGPIDPWEMSAANAGKWTSWGFENKTNDPRHDVTYTFGIGNWGEIKPTDKIEEAAANSLVRDIHLVPSGHFLNYSPTNINNIINNTLRPAVEVSPKVKGKGNLEFWPGNASVNDSLWFVANGWTVNQTQH